MAENELNNQAENGEGNTTESVSPLLAPGIVARSTTNPIGIQNFADVSSPLVARFAHYDALTSRWTNSQPYGRSTPIIARYSLFTRPFGAFEQSLLNFRSRQQRTAPTRTSQTVISRSTLANPNAISRQMQMEDFTATEPDYGWEEAENEQYVEPTAFDAPQAQAAQPTVTQVANFQPQVVRRFTDLAQSRQWGEEFAPAPTPTPAAYVETPTLRQNPVVARRQEESEGEQPATPPPNSSPNYDAPERNNTPEPPPTPSTPYEPAPSYEGPERDNDGGSNTPSTPDAPAPGDSGGETRRQATLASDTPPPPSYDSAPEISRAQEASENDISHFQPPVLRQFADFASARELDSSDNSAAEPPTEQISRALFPPLEMTQRVNTGAPEIANQAEASAEVSPVQRAIETNPTRTEASSSTPLPVTSTVNEATTSVPSTQSGSTTAPNPVAREIAGFSTPDTGNPPVRRETEVSGFIPSRDMPQESVIAPVTPSAPPAESVQNFVARRLESAQWTPTSEPTQPVLESATTPERTYRTVQRTPEGRASNQPINTTGEINADFSGVTQPQTPAVLRSLAELAGSREWGSVSETISRTAGVTDTGNATANTFPNIETTSTTGNISAREVETSGNNFPALEMVQANRPAPTPESEPATRESISETLSETATPHTSPAVQRSAESGVYSSAEPATSPAPQTPAPAESREANTEVSRVVEVARTAETSAPVANTTAEATTNPTSKDTENIENETAPPPIAFTDTFVEQGNSQSPLSRALSRAEQPEDFAVDFPGFAAESGAANMPYSTPPLVLRKVGDYAPPAAPESESPVASEAEPAFTPGTLSYTGLAAQAEQRSDRQAEQQATTFSTADTGVARQSDSSTPPPPESGASAIQRFAIERMSVGNWVAQLPMAQWAQSGEGGENTLATSPLQRLISPTYPTITNPANEFTGGVQRTPAAGGQPSVNPPITQGSNTGNIPQAAESGSFTTQSPLERIVTRAAESNTPAPSSAQPLSMPHLAESAMEQTFATESAQTPIERVIARTAEGGTTIQNTPPSINVNQGVNAADFETGQTPLERVIARTAEGGTTAQGTPSPLSMTHLTEADSNTTAQSATPSTNITEPEKAQGFAVETGQTPLERVIARAADTGSSAQSAPPALNMPHLSEAATARGIEAETAQSFAVDSAQTPLERVIARAADTGSSAQSAPPPLSMPHLSERETAQSSPESGEFATQPNPSSPNYHQLAMQDAAAASPIMRVVETDNSANSPVSSGGAGFAHLTPWLKPKTGESRAADSSQINRSVITPGSITPSVGQPMGTAIQRQMSNLLARDFSQVRVHTGDAAASYAAEAGAEAFTTGSDIYFAPGRYQPETPQGQALLGHELTHVIQQASLPKLGAGGTLETSAQGERLEQEASQVERIVLRHLSSNSNTQSAPPIERYIEPTRVEPTHLRQSNNSEFYGSVPPEIRPNSSEIRRSMPDQTSTNTTISRVIGEGGGTGSGGADVEAIARQVYRMLQKQLTVERERRGGRNNNIL